MEIVLEKQSDWIKLILSFSPAKSRVAQYFYAVAAAANKKKWKSIYPKIARIAHYAACSVRSVQRFNTDMAIFGLEVLPRFGENGRQTSNVYRFHKDFLKAMNWIDRRHGFDASEELKNKLIEEALKEDKPPSSQWMSPSPPGSCHPYSSSSSPMHIGVLLRGELKTSFYPCLNDINIPLEAKIGLSGYPERSVAMAVEDLELFIKQKGNGVNKLLFLAAQAGKHSGTRPQTRKPRNL